MNTSHSSSASPGTTVNLPKQCSVNRKAHNLNIQMYSFQEIMTLFHLQDVSPITEEHMKAAKMIVIRMHPDKSRMPPEYFIFYKKAFEVVVDFYNNQQRIHQPLPEKQVDYTPEGRGIGSSIDKEQIHSVIQKMKPEKFQDQFNRLFEENMLNQEKKRIEQERNQWFTQEAPALDVQQVHSTGDIHRQFETIKQQQASNYLARYRGVENLHVGGIQTGELYDDNPDSSKYIATDPFSKFKYDDLRKVHKDQTVFSVSEQDFQKVAQYASADHLQRTRGSQDLNPLDKAQAMKMLSDQERLWEQQYQKREYNAKLQTMQYEEKNKNVMSRFLQLTR
jgi:hypothetical protein